MTIAELAFRGKAAFLKVPKDILLVALFIFATSLSFWLGILTGRDMGAKPLAGQGQGIGIVNSAPLAAPAEAAVVTSTTGQYVASKNGTKYYLPSCSGAKQITDANKVWFATKSEAEAKGYQPSSTCKGL